MKKIMFNDRYALTEAVLRGKKTQTRRVINLTDTDKEYLDTAFDWDLRESVIIDRYAKYKVGEVVAVAQRYYDFRMSNGEVTDEFYKRCCKYHVPLECLGSMEGAINKMFVRADLMPHQICFTNRRVERLQEISDEDCLKEGILTLFAGNTPYRYFYLDRSQIPPIYLDGSQIPPIYLNRLQIPPKGVFFYTTPREAYAALINKVSGKGTWERNPWVLAYDFELVM